ncbi:TRAP-type C4-dicarboxylate transport system, small permease component [Sulfitobacter brevis]|uniref:TRAP transporter small permease protein n=1 Tax=Sulfitobacter brevis TaxID=74348 RepID=A0A1I2FRH2_9RHOB|nr:TRAP transporter small permease subunit [Sulfitobacter brevis]SFF07368.1 TRAP-type C4-dicarboxylate transport system, small permease component [Sulfitobacter brevis]
MLTRTFDSLLWLLAVIAAGILAAITVLITINVITRNFGLPGIYGALDAIQYALMVATFLGAPWVLSNNGHVKVDLITAAAPPNIRQILGHLVSIIGAASAGVLGWYGLQAVLASMGRGSMIRTSFVIPEWWMLSFVPLSMALCVIVFLRRLVQPPVDDLKLSGL